MPGGAARTGGQRSHQGNPAPPDRRRRSVSGVRRPVPAAGREIPLAIHLPAAVECQCQKCDERQVTKVAKQHIWLRYRGE